MKAIRNILRTGAAVFGGSALPLLFAPGLFADLLDLEANSDVNWSLQMTGITVLALAGNMMVNSWHENPRQVRHAGMVMLVAAAGMGVVTLLLPGGLTWFGWLYVVLGFGFSAAYGIGLSRPSTNA